MAGINAISGGRTYVFVSVMQNVPTQAQEASGAGALSIDESITFDICKIFDIPSSICKIVQIWNVIGSCKWHTGLVRCIFGNQKSFVL